MPFFIRNRSKSSISNKRKASRGSRAVSELASKKKRPAKPGSEDEEIHSDSDPESDAEEPAKEAYSSSSEEEEETAQEKRLRLAKQYLARLEEEEADKEDDEDFGRDAISHRLQQDAMEQAGRLHREVAQDLVAPSAADICVLRGHQLPVTCLVISPDDKFIYSASKDCSIVKWDIGGKKKAKVIAGGRKGTESKHVGHTAHVLCLAISSDDKFLASGDRNKLIHIWNPEDLSLIKTFTGHRDAVSGLAFRRGSHQLFSGSHDRSVKIWNCDELAYVETLFGHQDVVTGIDSLSRERALSSGGRDCSLRIWKIIEESQLIFNGHAGSIDCICLINEEHFLSGGDDNSLALWGVMKKKPLATVKNAHPTREDNGTPWTRENWITAVASHQYSDLVASGSSDGCIRLWRCGPGFHSLHLVCTIPVVGFVNSLKFSSDGQFLVAGVGQEHRLGRWWRIKQARNSVCIIKLPRHATNKNSETS